MFLATYLIARDDILTNITLSKLGARKIDVLTWVAFAEVCLRDGKEPSIHLARALYKLYSKQKARLPLRLNTQDRSALLELVELKGYRHNRTLIGTPLYDCAYRCVTHTDATQYLNLYGWRKYWTLWFGNQSPAAMVGIKKQLNKAHHMSGVNKYKGSVQQSSRAKAGLRS